MSDPNQPPYQQPVPPLYGQQPVPPGYGQPPVPPQYVQQPVSPGYGPQPAPGPYGQQPQYGQPYPQQRFPQQPRKNHRVLIVSIIAAVVVLVGFAGAVAIAYNLTRDDDSPAPTSTANAAAGGEQRLRLTAPDSIGAWKKTSNPETANKLSTASSVAVIDEPFAAQYDNAGATVSIWGGTGRTIGYDTISQAFQEFLKAALAANPGTPGTPSPVDPGMLGGEAYCSPITSSTGKATVCLWHAQQVALAFLFTGTDPDTAATQVKPMLAGLLTFR
jgi:hypothetical protein